MNTPFTLTLEQVDTINLSLAKAMAITQMVAECGGERHPGQDELPHASLFVVMQVIEEELEKVVEMMTSIGHGTDPSSQFDDVSHAD